MLRDTTWKTYKDGFEKSKLQNIYLGECFSSTTTISHITSVTD